MRQNQCKHVLETKRRIAEQTDQLRRDVEHMPMLLDRVTDIPRDPGGRPNIQKALSLQQWNDGHGNIIYTAIRLGTPIAPDVVRSLATRISTQRATFTNLDVAEQSQIRTEFTSSKGKSASVQPYQDLLRSEAVGRRFEAIKQQQAVKR